MLRTIPNLYRLLKKKESTLPYKLYKENTLRVLKKRMDWDKRVYEDTYKSMPEQTKYRQISESEYAHGKAWQLVYSLYDQLEGMRAQTDWKHIDNNDTDQVRNTATIQKTFNETFKTMHGAPMSLADMYAMIEVLKATQEQGTAGMDATDDLLTTDTEDAKDD